MRNKRNKDKDLISEKAKEVVDGLERLFSMVPNPDWLTKQ